MTVSELQVVVGADVSKAEAGLSRVGGAISSFAGALTVGAAAAGAGLAAGIAVGVKAAGDLEQAVANISTIKPEIDTSAVFAQLNEMQTRIPQTGAQLGEALYNVFSSVEVTAEQGLALTEKFGKGAVAAQTDAQTFGTSIMGVLNAYKLSVEDADHVSDVFFNTVNKGVITGQELAASLGPVTQSAKAAGLSVDELGAYIAAVTKEGGPAAQNVNNLNNFLQKVTTKEAQLQLNALGIATKTATGEFRPTTEVLTDLKAKLGGMTEAAKANALQAIFPDAQARQGAMVLLSQLELVKDVTEENTKASGVAEEAYRKMSQTFNAQSKLLVNGLNSILTTIGGALLPHITPLITTFSQWLPRAFEATKKTLTDLLDVFNGGDSFDAAFERLANVLPEGVAMAVVDGVRQIGDAWRTMQQAMAGEWQPSAEIEGLASAAGNAVLTVQALAQAVASVVERAAALGTGDALSRAVGTLGEVAGVARDRLGELGAALDLLNQSSGGTSAKMDVLALGIRTLGTAAELGALNLKLLIDTTITAGTVAVNAAALFGNLGAALVALATGDIPGYEAALQRAAVAMLANAEVAANWATRTTTTVSAAAEAVGTLIEQGTARAATATETNMGAAVTAVETNMGAAVTAVETNMGAAVTAVEAAGPQMERAAGSAARRAAEAVEAQRGAAEAAGHSVGDSIGSGLVAGIKSWLGSVIAAGAELAAAAVGAARGPEGADAHSPSRKMIELGRDMTAGLEQGLSEAGVGVAMVAQIRDLMAAAREYVPVAGEIKRVENEIKTIRDQAQTEALFRAKEMVVIDSESLRLKQAQVSLERDLLPLRQDLARATREVSDIERGSLSERTGLIEMDGERKKLRLQQIDLEKQLIGRDSGSKKAKAIQEQIDKLREKDRALALEAERINLTNQVAATGARIRKEQLDDQARGQQAVIDMIGEQIAVLAAERAVFNANEAVIKNATDNEIAYRNQLIAVFRAEGQPILARINAGLALVEQLEAEGKIGKEVADALRTLAKEAGASAEATKGLATAAGEEAPQIESAAQKVKAMTGSFDSVKNAATGAERAVAKYIGTLNELPDGKFGGSLSERLQKRAMGGPVTAGRAYIVGEQRPELFVPSSSGTILPRVPEIGGGRTTVVNVTVQGSLIHQHELERVVIDAVGGGWRRGVSLGVR